MKKLLLVLLCLFVTACGSNDNSDPNPSTVNAISVSGSQTFADGTPIAGKNVQYQFILDGANMFQAGVNGCTQTPAHVAGTVIQDGTSGAQGQYSLSVPVHTLSAAVVHACQIENLNLNQVEGLTLKASILADDSSCPAYCSAQNTPGSSCVEDCSTGNRTIVAAETLTQQQVDSAVQGGTIQWSGPLVFKDLGPALDVGGGPKLVVDAQSAQTSAHITQEYFAPGACEVEQSCIRAPGMRTLLRFDGTIENLGDEDLVIGSSDNNALFTQDSCHHVPLLKDIMLYELVDTNTGSVVQVNDQDVIGRKEGFCMMDITQINATAPQGKYNCDNQGITAGWADVYDAALDCQFLDVTGVPAGNYNLRLTVNPEGILPDANLTNASVTFPVTVPSVLPSPDPSTS